MEQRRRQTTVAQLSLLVDFLSKHKDFALGRVRSKEARALPTRLWAECSLILNAEGPARTSKEWAKIWNDLKTKVRAKLTQINANHQRTGGGPNTGQSLTPIEEKMAQILGRDVGPIPNVRLDPFAYTNELNNEEQNNFEDGGNLVPDSEYFVISNVEVVDDTLAPHPHESAELPAYHEDAVLPAHDSAITETGAVNAPLSPVPSETGHTPMQSLGTRGRLRRVGQGQRQRERHAAVRPAPPAQSNRSALQESRMMILQIEKMRAEASMNTARGFQLLAESVDRLTRQYTRQGEASPREDPYLYYKCESISVCLSRFHAKTTEPIAMKFCTQIF